MKKDIPIKKVEDVIMAIVPREELTEGEDLWDVYIINLKDTPILSVLINSTGYGEIGGERRRSSTFRHFFEEIGPLEVRQVEAIHSDLFCLTNQFWVSFSHGDYLYDKKFIFLPGSIREELFTEIPFLPRKGVMIK